MPTVVKTTFIISVPFKEPVVKVQPVDGVIVHVLTKVELQLDPET